MYKTKKLCYIRCYILPNSYQSNSLHFFSKNVCFLNLHLVLVPVFWQILWPVPGPKSVSRLRFEEIRFGAWRWGWTDPCSVAFFHGMCVFRSHSSENGRFWSLCLPSKTGFPRVSKHSRLATQIPLTFAHIELNWCCCCLLKSVWASINSIQ